MFNKGNARRFPEFDLGQLRSALLTSAVTTILCVVLVGVPFLPHEVANLKGREQMRVVHCEPLPGGDSVVLLMKSNSMARLKPVSAFLVVLNLDNTECQRPYATIDTTLELIAMEPGGNRIFMGDQRGGLFFGNVPNNTGYYFIGNTLLDSSSTRMACAPDGNTLLTHDESSLVAWNIVNQAQKSKPRWCRFDSSITCFAIYPDSQTAICSRTHEGQTELLEMDLQRGETRFVLGNMDRKLVKLTVSPDADLILGVDELREVVMLRRNGAQQAWQPLQIPGLVTGSARIVSFSPYARLLIASNRTDDQLHLWDVDQQRLLGRLEWQESSQVKGCCFLDRNRILTWNSDDILRVWDLPSLSLVQELPLSPRLSRG